jgi:histidyl-tRNA synthetase
VPQLFRYERTQRGRLREHFQWNVDIAGEAGIAADAEVLATALDALIALGLTEKDVVARFNDRRLLEKLFLHAGVPTERLLAVYGAVDRLTREPLERVRERILATGVVAPVADAVLRVFSIEGGLEGFREEFADVGGIAEEIFRLERYERDLQDLGLGGFIAFDPAIVRGLAYYTGTVFEIFDRRGELRAICGGGRYDGLLRSVSDVDMPAAGFGMGDVVLGELLADCGLLPVYAPAVDYYVVAVTPDERGLVRRVAAYLRSKGGSVAYGLKEAGVGKQFKEANALGARQTVVLGPEETAAGVAVVRAMDSGEERRAPLAELVGDESARVEK